LQGVEKGKAAGFLPWHADPSAFNLAEYQHYEQVQNGDLNWIIPGELPFATRTLSSCRMLGTAQPKEIRCIWSQAAMQKPCTLLLVLLDLTVNGVKRLSCWHASLGAGKLMAFAGPSAEATYFYGWKQKVPEDYHSFFAASNVTAVIRLNKKVCPKGCSCTVALVVIGT
jgi:hypothetical protein